ncbi:MAG: hypothetical protein K8R36_11355 [Planctomycetales bacterium]|nr:hypothetical protein [Planctomycetales bacterium]
MTSTFFEKMNEMRHVLDSGAPLSEQWSLIRPLLADEDVEREFWAYLNDPNWVALLAAETVISNPPPVEHLAEGSLRFRPWPASRFLARIADQAPEDVAKVLSDIKTDNPAVLGDIIDAALAIPVGNAVVLVPTIASAARSGLLRLSVGNAVELCEKLAEGGYVESALELADALFAPPKTLSGADQNALYWYREGLKKIVPSLASKAGVLLLPQMCDWLQQTIELTERPDESTSDDYSCVWRPAIEEHEQNSDHQISAVLVGFVRQAFEVAILAKQLTLTEALKLLAKYNLLVFERLRVHLIGEFADQDTELFKRVALDRRYFEDHHFKHEYAILISKRFEMLSDEEKKVWFEWIDRGPEMTNFDENFHSWHEREPTNQDRKNRIEYWQFEKLHLIRHDLEGDRLNFYRQMLATHGEPRMADLNVRSGPMRWGNESPFSVEQLAATPFPNTVELVVGWKGERDSFEGPDLEGLASAFESYVATNPVAFAADANVLIGKPAIFVRGFIRKISEAISTSQPVPIEPVLKLCRWVIEQPIQERNTPDDNRAGMVDRDWQWTRDEISRLIESVCTADRGDVPHYPLKAFRKEIWGLLESLCHDAASSYIVRDPSKDDLRTHDYLDVAINSPRGKAVEAALEYARWVANHIKVKEEKREIVPQGFASMPEVQEMLEWQIASDNRTVEVLAIIGSKIPLLNWIDKSWLELNANRIFDLPEIERNPHNAAGWAAWNAFLDWVSPHVDFYKIFKPQYAYAVAQCAKVPSAENSRHHPMNHLGEHLVLLHGRGQLELDDDEGILRTFLATANADVRRHAIGFIGQVLERDNEVPQAILDRFMRLWDFYWSSVGKQDAEQRPDAWLFGPWFTSEVFPSEWAFSRLEEFAQVAGVPEPAHAQAAGTSNQALGTKSSRKWTGRACLCQPELVHLCTLNGRGAPGAKP